PELIDWAIARSGLADDELARRFPKLPEWRTGERSPTVRQLEAFATATRTSVQTLRLPEPPSEQVPIPDRRTRRDHGSQPPSPDLLETVQQCQQRQAWYRTYAEAERDGPIELIGTMSTDVPTDDAAPAMRQILDFDVGSRGSASANALRLLADRAE